MKKSSKIYIAGHTGLAGSALSRGLEARGYKNLIYRAFAGLDLRRQADTEAFFREEKPEYVFLSAGRVGGILANDTYKADFIYDNIMVAANVVQAARLTGVRKLLNLGSSCIYPRMAPQPIKEASLLTGTLEPTNEPYAIAKIAALKMCRYYNECRGTDFISVMPTNLYGPGDNFNLETAHVIPALIRKFHLAKLLSEGRYEAVRKDLLAREIGFKTAGDAGKMDDRGIDRLLERIGIKREGVSIWGDGREYREFLYADDLAGACIFLMENHGYKDVGEIINIGTGRDILIEGLAALIKNIVGYKGKTYYDASRPSGTPRKLLDISKITALGWKPKIELEDGIRNEYRWYLGA